MQVPPPLLIRIGDDKMNKSIKITLLIVAIIAAVGGVMAYYKTIVSPPSHLAFSNQYVSAVKDDIAHLSDVSTTAGLDSSFVVITDEINFIWKDTLLDNEERDELLEAFAVQYVPKFAEDCNKLFVSADWYESQLKQLSSKITQLRSLRSSGGTAIIGGDAGTSLSKVESVISAYYSAKAVAANTRYSSLAAARTKIAQAKRYASMSPINNCRALVAQLNTVPARLEQSHYAYLVGQVNRLKNYYNYDQTSYDNLALGILDKLDEYKKKARSVYGHVSDISSLEQRAGDLYGNAQFNNDYE